MSPLPRVPAGRPRRSGTGDRADERRVGLGTSEVATYRSGWTNGLLLGVTNIGVGEWEPFTPGPHNRFGGVIVVDKGGIADVLR